jgi:hypothetical protein
MNCLTHTVLAAALVSSVFALPALAKQTEPLPMEPWFQLNPTSAEDLETQTRTFQKVPRSSVLFASAGVLQDMGYKITGGERRFGLLLGQKMAAVESPGAAHAIGEAALVTTTVILSLLVGEDLVTDLPEQVAQQIHISLLVSEGDSENGEVEVRISLDRDMHYDHGGIVPDHTELPKVYQEFFERLSRAVYLEGEQL